MSETKDHYNDLYKIFSKLFCAEDVKAVQYATYITLDTSNSLTKDIKAGLDYLKQKYNLNNSIKFTMIKTNDDSRGDVHQWYSHLGWDYDYTIKKIEGWDNL